MRVLICGDREWRNLLFIISKLNHLSSQAFRKGNPISLVIDGGARGADRLGNRAAKLLGLKTRTFYADWRKFGPSAGPIRNQQMLVDGKPDYVLAFHHNYGLSKGTKDMLTRALRAGLPVELYDLGGKLCRTNQDFGVALNGTFYEAEAVHGRHDPALD